MLKIGWLGNTARRYNGRMDHSVRKAEGKGKARFRGSKLSATWRKTAMLVFFVLLKRE